MIRRSALLLAFTGPALLLNLALAYVGTLVLSSEQFGIFYLATTLSNMMFAPSVVLTLCYARFFALTRQEFGVSATAASVRRYIIDVAKWAALLSLLLLAGLLGTGELVGIKSPMIVILVVLTGYLAYVAETGRAAMQGLQRFTALGLYTLSWMLFRFMLGAGALALYGSVATGLFGVAVSAMVVFPCFLYWLSRQSDDGAPTPPAVRPRMTSMVPIAIGYSIFIMIYYVDVVLAYFVLNDETLGRYAASAILPKGLILATMPIVQVVFPVIVNRAGGTRPGLEIVARSAAATVGAAVAVAAVLIAGADLFCSPEFGLRHCQSDLLATMTYAAVPLCLLRIFVIIDFGTGRDWMPLLLLIVPTLAFAAYILFDGDPASITPRFMYFAYGITALYGILLAVRHRRAIAAALERTP